MQSGLMNTYQHPASNRSWVAWALSALLFAAYILLYFGPMPALGLRFDLLQRAAEVVGRGLGLPRRPAQQVDPLRDRLHAGHGRRAARSSCGATATAPTSASGRSRSWRVQVVFAFLLPIVLQVFGRHEYYFSYFWPLKIEYFYPSVILQQPFLIVFWSFLGSLVAFPLLAFFLGKRFYCSWVCGCGGLANTFGEPFRHLSSKSARAWSIEKVSIHTVLFLALVTTAIVWVNWAVGKQHPAFAALRLRASRTGTASRSGRCSRASSAWASTRSWARASGAASAARWRRSSASCRSSAASASP